MTHHFRLIALALGGLFAAAALAQREVPVVRVSEPLTIDARDSDWPVPATVSLLSLDGNAQMRFAADDTVFYAYVEVKDESPLKNSASRPEEIIGGGDAVAFYFQTNSKDAQRIALAERNGKSEVYVYRPSSVGKKPFTFQSPVAVTAFEYVAPIDATVSFAKGRSKDYAVEVAIPWAALGYAEAPEHFGFDAQVLFSDPGGTQTMGMAWLFATDGPGHTIEDLPTMARLYPDTWGRAQLVDEVRVPHSHNEAQPVDLDAMTMIEVDLPRAGRLSLSIVDDNGWILRELVMAEKYNEGHHRILWDGRDRYGEPLSPGKYLWQALLFDGMRTKFRGSVGNSGRPPYRTADGLGSMGGQHGSYRAVAADHGGIYMSGALQEGPPNMRKIDATTGNALWKRSAGGFKAIDAIAAAEGMACIVNSHGKRGNNASFLIRLDPDTGKGVDMGDGDAEVRIEGAESFYDVKGLAIAGGIAWYALPERDRIGGIDLTTGATLATIDIPKPVSLARRDAATLLVCSEDRLLAIDIATRETSVILDGLDAPKAVAVDAESRLYVSETGAKQQVSRFSPDGKLLSTWGKPGGSSNQQIPYEPMAFRNVAGIAIGPQGNIWLAEIADLVKRTVKLDAEGNWLEDFYGPVAYNAFGPDLDDFSRVYYTVNGGCFIETHVDYEQYRRDSMQPAKAWQIRAIHDLGLAADGVNRNELMSQVAGTGYGHVIVFRADNGRRYFFRPSKHNRAKVPPGAGIWIDRDGRWVPCAFIARDTKNHRSWADANGDGLIQPEEEYEGLPVREVAWIDRDLTIHGFEGKLSPSAVGNSGVPAYLNGPFAPYLDEGEDSHLGNQWTFFSYGTGDNTVYYISNHGPHRHLSFWDRATENRLIKIENGKVQWIAGQHDAHPGFTGFSTSSGIAGTIDGVVLVQNIEPCNYIAYTEDGFVLGDIMVDDDGVHPKVGSYVINIESFTGLYVKDPATDRNVLFAVSSGDDRILEVTGPGRTKRLHGKVELTKVAARGRAPLEIPYSTWYGNTYRGLGIDGEDSEWKPEVRPVSIEAQGEIIADVRMRRDAGALFLVASVLDQQLAEGSGVSLTLADRQTDGLQYQFSFLLTQDEGRNWVVVPSAVRDGEPVEATGIDAVLTKRWLELGYRLEVEIPLALLPEFTEPRKQTFRRRRPGTKDMGTMTEERPDLRGPVFLNLRVRRSDKTGPLARNGGLTPVSLGR